MAHLAPKNSECRNPLEISRLDFRGSRRHPPHWLSSKGPNYQHGVLVISAGANEGKTTREIHQGCLVLAQKFPGSPGTCNSEETDLLGISSVFITLPILRMWHRRTATCSLEWRNNWKVAICRPIRRSLLPRRPGWTDKFLIFFEWFATGRATV